MDRLFLIFGQTFLYWNSLLLVLAAAAGICAFVSLYLLWDGKPLTAAVFVPCALALSVLLGRLVHWYCLPNQYGGMASAFRNLSSGGYALLGAFAACLIVGLLLWGLRMVDDFPRFLDCLSVAGCGAIAVGRLSFFYSSLDRGSIISVRKLPAAYPVLNAVSGALEYRFATFLFQAIAMAVLFSVLLYLLLRERCLVRIPAGDITIIFGLCYCAVAVLLDSTRYDSLYFRSNGFVSVVQILSAVVVVACAVQYSLRLVRADGMKKWYFLIWGLQLLMVGGAGFMEYYVQRHGREALFSYIVMGACLAQYCALTLLLRFWALTRERIHDRNLYAGKTEEI